MNAAGPSSQPLPRRLARAALRIAVSPMLAAVVATTLMSASTWQSGDAWIEDVSSTLMGIRRLVSGDSDHYLAIADSLREGDFRMTHVEPTGGADRAHRQPGYPALLALAGTFGVERAPDLARVNLAVLVASFWFALMAGRIATGSWLAGVLAAAMVRAPSFLYDIATSRLLSEPLYVAVALVAAGCGLAYLSRASAAALLGTAALAAAAYLVRVNGLFLAVALALVMVAADLARGRRAAPDVPAVDLVLHLPLAAYAGALALFVVVAAPSWLPRLVYTGNPIYHGYLTNYLWVDDYERAHVPGPPRYSLSTYVAEHSAGDAVHRLTYGLERVFWETPRDKFGTAAFAALIAATFVLLVLRDRSGLLLLAAAVLQALPLAWTALPNPSRRLAAAALLPFAALLVAAAVAAIVERSHPRTLREDKNNPAPLPPA